MYVRTRREGNAQRRRRVRGKSAHIHKQWRARVCDTHTHTHTLDATTSFLPACLPAASLPASQPTGSRRRRRRPAVASYGLTGPLARLSLPSRARSPSRQRQSRGRTAATLRPSVRSLARPCRCAIISDARRLEYIVSVSPPLHWRIQIYSRAIMRTLYTYTQTNEHRFAYFWEKA